MSCSPHHRRRKEGAGDKSTKQTRRDNGGPHALSRLSRSIPRDFPALGPRLGTGGATVPPRVVGGGAGGTSERAQGGGLPRRRRKHDGSPHKGQGLVARRGRRDATPRAPMFYYNAKQKHTKLRRLALSMYMPPRACHDCRRRLEASAARRGRTAHPTFLTPSGRCAARRGRRRGGRPRSQG